MRKSLVDSAGTTSDGFPHPTVSARRPVAWTLTIALAASVALGVATFIDQAAVGSLTDHVRATYAPYGLRPDANGPAVFLYIVAGVGALLWVITLVRARKRSGKVIATVATALTALLALLTLTITEYGAPLFPAFWGILALLSPVAGIVATILLFRRNQHGRTRRA